MPKSKAPSLKIMTLGPPNLYLKEGEYVNSAIFFADNTGAHHQPLLKGYVPETMKRISLLLVALSATSLVSLSQSMLMELPGKVMSETGSSNAPRLYQDMKQGAWKRL